MINTTIIRLATTDIESAEAVFQVAKPLFITILIIVILKILFTNIYLIAKAAKSRSKKPFGNYFMGVLFPDILLILILIIIWFLAPTIMQMF